ALTACCLASTARADVSLGGHLGVNLDHGNVHLGVDALIPVKQISPRVQLALWPNFAHVFIHDYHDVELLGFDVPFIFNTVSDVVLPFVAPGLGLSIGDESTVKVNAIGGVFFHLGRVRPFTAVALRFVRGTYADWLAGVLVDL
ncbi:MAG: hypothetical protein RLZZ450_5052, partial [Pseudomonadota bacterium]